MRLVIAVLSASVFLAACEESKKPQNSEQSATATVRQKELAVHNKDGIELAGARDFPWQVYISADSECGGVIVGKKWVLTAAHCVYGKFKDEGEVQVMIGSKISGEGEEYIVNGSDIKFPGQYHKAIDAGKVADEFDLALLPLPRAIDTNNSAAIRIGKENDEPAAGTLLYIAGWVCGSPLRKDVEKGVTDAGCGDAMVFTQVSVLSRADCDTAYKSKYFLCAGGNLPRPGVEEDDSGSGLVTAAQGCATLIGIAKFAGVIDGYSRVSQHESWFRTTMGDQVVDASGCVTS